MAGSEPGHDGILVMPPPVFRFAPSPNGFLHLGHAYSALLNCELARQSGGRFLLRIEDIDATRCRPEFETAIYEDLHWLGIAWETPVRRQLDHLADYRAALDRLAAMGLLYPSFESRAEIAALVKEREAEGVWPRDPTARCSIPARRSRCLRMNANGCCDRAASRCGWIWKPHAAPAGDRAGPRHDYGREARSPAESPHGREAWGDVVLARKETPTSYHLSVVIDDALQGVTEVVRGQDLFWSTGVPLMQKILGRPPRLPPRLRIRDARAKLTSRPRATGCGIAHRGEGCPRRCGADRPSLFSNCSWVCRKPIAREKRPA